MDTQKVLDSCERIEKHHRKCCIAYTLLMVNGNNKTEHSEYVSENYNKTFDVVEYCEGVLSCVQGEVSEVLDNINPSFNQGYSNQYSLEQATNHRSSMLESYEQVEDLG